uniref:WAP four-disulfide core domain protein 2 n=1 Tax=Suricata suricatta TaxID=37032 RepID=A0A673UZZ5_SURSU
MPACRPGPHAAPLLLLLGLLLLGFSPVLGGEAEKPGVCPQLQADQNCTQECHSDAECADNLKCCQAGCAAFCHLPNAPAASHSLRSGGVEVSARPCLAPAQLPSPLSGLCTPFRAEHSFCLFQPIK